MRFAAESPDSSQLLRSCKRGKDGDVREEREGGGGGESRPGAGVAVQTEPGGGSEVGSRGGFRSAGLLWKVEEAESCVSLLPKHQLCAGVKVESSGAERRRAPCVRLAAHIHITLMH